jgi:hypothetical protein
MTPDGEHHAIAYASRKLLTHERNYTPFLLEMQAAIWGMNHFDTHLRGRHFILFTDHKPLEKLGKVHTRTLNRLQEAMNQFDFEIQYKKGSEMPADFLSRNVYLVSWDNRYLHEEQDKDPITKALKNYLLHKELPRDPKCQQLVKLFSPDCFIENDVVWRRMGKLPDSQRVVIFLPQSLIPSVLQEAHGHLLTGHDGILKTKERLLNSYYWVGMDRDIHEHLQSCHKCQLRRKDRPPLPNLLTPLPQPTEPNQRIHADLFGPLRTSGNGKRFLLCITDAFTKYIELASLDNKEAETVTEAIFQRWICRYGIPLEIITDQGKEFCNRLSDDLYQKLGTHHQRTSPRHPACNSQAEVANKTIAKYLASFVDESTLDWEYYVYPLTFYYNTSFHRSIQATPYELTYGMEPRMPGIPGPELRRKFYGESTTDERIQRLLFARDLARRHNEEATEKTKKDYDKKATPHNYTIGQLVLLDEHSFLHKNTKLAPKWSGPHRILKLKGPVNVELKLKNEKHLLVHTNRLKPYVMPTPLEETNPDPAPEHPLEEMDKDDSNNELLSDHDQELFQDSEFLHKRYLESDFAPLSDYPEPSPEVHVPVVPFGAPPVVRKRGRPKKEKTVTIAVPKTTQDITTSTPVVPERTAVEHEATHRYSLRSRGPPSDDTSQIAINGSINPDAQVDSVLRGVKYLRKFQKLPPFWTRAMKFNYLLTGDPMFSFMWTTDVSRSQNGSTTRRDPETPSDVTSRASSPGVPAQEIPEDILEHESEPEEPNPFARLFSSETDEDELAEEPEDPDLPAEASDHPRRPVALSTSTLPPSDPGTSRDTGTRPRTDIRRPDLPPRRTDLIDPARYSSDHPSKEPSSARPRAESVRQPLRKPYATGPPGAHSRSSSSHRPTGEVKVTSDRTKTVLKPSILSGKTTKVKSDNEAKPTFAQFVDEKVVPRVTRSKGTAPTEELPMNFRK